MRHLAGQVDDPPRSRGQLAHERVPVLTQMHQLDQLVDTQRCTLLVVEHHRQSQGCRQRTAIGEPTLQRDGQGLADGHVREKSCVLETAPETARRSARRAQQGDVVTTQHHASTECRREPADQIEQGGLASTVRTDDADDLAFGHIERHVGNGADTTERARNLGDGQRGGHTGRSRSDSVAAIAAIGRYRARHHAGYGTRLAHRSLRQEDRPQQIGPSQQLCCRTAEPDAAALHEVRPFGNGQGNVDALLDQHHRHPSLGQTAHDGQQLSDDHGCQTQREFVDQQHPRTSDEGHCQRQHLLLAARQVGRGDIDAVVK